MPASCNWPANQPSDKISTWLYISSDQMMSTWPDLDVWSGAGWHFVRWAVHQAGSCNWQANQASDKISTWPYISSDQMMSTWPELDVWLGAGWHLVRWAVHQWASCNWPANKPSDKNVNLTQSQILGRVQWNYFQGVHLPMVRLTFC